MSCAMRSRTFRTRPIVPCYPVGMQRAIGGLVVGAMGLVACAHTYGTVDSTGGPRGSRPSLVEHAVRAFGARQDDGGRRVRRIGEERVRREELRRRKREQMVGIAERQLTEA